MKKVLAAFLLMLMIAFTACGSGGSGAASTGLSPSDLSIEDFTIDVGKKLIDGDRYYAYDFTNNSEYDLLGVELKYSISEETPDSELKVYKEFLDEYGEDLDDVTLRDVQLMGDKEKLIGKGESSTAIPFLLGAGGHFWYEEPNGKQFALMSPDCLTLAVVKGNRMYIAYYDYISESWSIDEETEQLNEWFENEACSLIPRPENCIIKMNGEADDDWLWIEAYGVTDEYFKSYVEAVKERGFTEDVYSSDGWYGAKDSNGNSISLSFYGESGRMDVDISVKIKAEGEDE